MTDGVFLHFEIFCFRKCVSVGANSLWRDVRCDNWAGKLGNTWPLRLPGLPGNQWDGQKNQNEILIQNGKSQISDNSSGSQEKFPPRPSSKIQNATDPWQGHNDSTHVSIMNAGMQDQTVALVCQMPLQQGHQLREKQESVPNCVARQLYLLAAISVTILCLAIMLCILIVVAILWNNGFCCFHKDSVSQAQHHNVTRPKVP